MKFIRKAVVWIFWFLFGWIIDWADNKIFIYKKRLQMVPTSFKWFIWFLGVIVGASGTMIYIQAPEIAHELTKASEPITYVNPAHAEVVPVAEVKVERDLADYIWLKESTRGKKNYSKCEALGKVNGIGYAIPGDGSHICFDSHEDEMIALNGWITVRKASGWSELKMLCTYSGNNYDECKK